MHLNTQKNITIYKGKNGVAKLLLDPNHDTVWATQEQIVTIFDIDQSVVSRHINSVFKNAEVDRKSNMQKMHITKSDKPVFLYSLDVILAVGYRTNSSRAIEFRKWTNKILKQHILHGYSVNKKLLSRNYQLFIQSLNEIRDLLPNSSQIAKGTLEIVSIFSNTWLTLETYDTEGLPKTGFTKKDIDISANELLTSLQSLKVDLIEKKEASNLFLQEREPEIFSGILRSVYQTFNGQNLYPTLEEKAANLLYLIVKNHPFIDGNKRSGAFSFVWFLKKAGLLNPLVITPELIAALTIFIAESKPQEKDKLIGIILLVLKQ